MKKIAILGSTGSVGRKALSVVEHLGEGYELCGLAVHSSTEELESQIRRWKPKVAGVIDPRAGAALRAELKGCGTEIFSGSEALSAVVESSGADTLVVATTGREALRPTYEALGRGLRVALASKELMVMAGQALDHRMKEGSGHILPVDSEHSAVFQCLDQHPLKELRRVLLTGTGGPFRGRTRAELADATPEQAVAHPKWRMGKKISVDSATLMNKGLEIIEARWLFRLDVEQIEVVIHPEAIIHSMVEWVDGTLMAQMSFPDMWLPLQYSLTYPDRLPSQIPGLKLSDLGQLSFEIPDRDSFPCLGLAWEAARVGGNMPCVLNAANDVAVAAFLKGRIGFMQIPDIIEKVMSRHRSTDQWDLEGILELDDWARAEAGVLVKELVAP